jgi:hypothetical protein
VEQTAAFNFQHQRYAACFSHDSSIGSDNYYYDGAAPAASATTMMMAQYGR